MKLLSELGEYVFDERDGEGLNPNRERRPPTKIKHDGEDAWYDGEWIIGTDIREGKGKMIHKYGFNECWFKNNLRAIRGREIIPDGGYYLGQLDNDQMNGKGTLKLSYGFEYTGDWKDNCCHGHGCQ